MLQAFNRGKIRSDDPNIIGNKILPNPPINIGIIIKKVINKPWNDIILLYCWADVIRKPIIMTSHLINNDNANPTEPPIVPLRI